MRQKKWGLLCLIALVKDEDGRPVRAFAKSAFQVDDLINDCEQLRDIVMVII